MPLIVIPMMVIKTPQLESELLKRKEAKTSCCPNIAHKARQKMEVVATKRKAFVVLPYYIADDHTTIIQYNLQFGVLFIVALNKHI